MLKTKRSRTWTVVALAIAVAAVPLQPGRAHAQEQLSGIGHYFGETNQAVAGAFWEYWQTRGALAQQGYPISPEMSEVSETDGNEYTVQYFERAVFEWHPENQPPYDVLLSLLGVRRYNEKYPGGAPNQQPNTSPGSVLFPQTGKRAGGRFLEYWRTHGGLAQQGYPISDEFTEVSELNGQPYTVQYFERAVFEYHPENAPPNDVLLSQLGTFQYAAKYQSDLPNLAGDMDGDSLADGDDACPRSAENINNVFDTDGCPDTMQTLLVFAAEDIDAYWSQVFNNSQVRYAPPVSFVAYNSPIDTACGEALPFNAFYCSRDHAIYYHYDFLQEQLDTDGDFAPVTIIAHEWGHLVQANLGLLETAQYTIQLELQADCFAGAWAASAGEADLLEEGDLEEGATALFRAGDNLDTPWFDPGAHGQPDQRVDAFGIGLDQGPEGCTAE
jgi:predicted metalloprotease